jgi:hypothetical protein
MLHVLSNELSRSFQISRYDTETELINDLDEKVYHMIFINILQAGTPRALDYAQDIHIKNPGVLLLSLCPAEEYKYFRDIAKEYASFKGAIQYNEIKNVLCKALKQIDVQENVQESEQKYAKIKLKRKEDYVEIDRITYVEKKKNYIGIHTVDRSFYCYNDCQELFEKLSMRPEQFLRVADNYLINFNQLYGMEKVEGTKKLWIKKRNQYYAIMVGYKQVPIEEENYDSIFKRFVDEIIKNNRNRQLILSS